MHPVVPCFHLVATLMQEQCEHGNRKRDGRAFVGMLDKAKHRVRRTPAIHTGALIETGELQKADPLPPGRYWIDVFEDKLAVFQAWFLTTPGVVMENQEKFEPEGTYPARTWYLFEVKKPAPWGLATKLGWPTIATADVRTSDDTVQKPDPSTIPVFPTGGPDIFPDWKDVSPGWKVAVIGGVVLLVAVAASYAVRGFR